MIHTPKRSIAKSMPDPPMAGRNRGPEPWPHWHDAETWTRYCIVTQQDIANMTAESFHHWVLNGLDQDVKGFFYGVMRWPEGRNYCADLDYCRGTGLAMAQQSVWPQEPIAPYCRCPVCDCPAPPDRCTNPACYENPSHSPAVRAALRHDWEEGPKRRAAEERARTLRYRSYGAKGRQR